MRIAAFILLAVSWPTVLLCHPHDPGYLRKASDRLVRDLQTREGTLVLERAARRLCQLTLETLPGVEKNQAYKIAAEVVPRDIREQVQRSGMIEEAGEILLFWGGVKEPDERCTTSMVRRSVPTLQCIRRLRARLRRHFRLAEKAPGLPEALKPRIDGPKSLSADVLETRRIAWTRAVIPQGAPEAPLFVPLQRFDADEDGYTETCAIDSDLDGEFDRFEADLDGDRIFETAFQKQEEGWIAEDTLYGKLVRQAGSPGSPTPRVEAEKEQGDPR